MHFNDDEGSGEMVMIIIKSMMMLMEVVSWMMTTMMLPSNEVLIKVPCPQTVNGRILGCHPELPDFEEKMQHLDFYP